MRSSTRLIVGRALRSWSCPTRSLLAAVLSTLTLPLLVFVAQLHNTQYRATGLLEPSESPLDDHFEDMVRTVSRLLAAC